MEKRLFIAILISFAFLLGWSRLAPRLFPELAREQKSAATPAAAKKPASNSSPSVQNAGATARPAVATALVPAQETRVVDVVIDRPLYRARFSNRGAQLRSFELKNYKDKKGNVVDLVKERRQASGDYPFALYSADRAWNARVDSMLYSVEQQKLGNKEVVTFRGVDTFGHAVTKSFAFDDTYFFSFKVDVASATLPFRMEIGPGLRTVSAAQKESQLTTTGNGFVLHGDDMKIIDREKSEGFKVFPAPLDASGLDDNYFVTALKPTQSGDAILRTAEWKSLDEKEEKRKELFAGLNAANGSLEGNAYFGPKDAALLDQFGLGKVVHFGSFALMAVIARFLLKALVYVNGFTHNYGWAIVVLTIIIKLILYPLQHKSIVSMKKMQKVQPKVNAIKEKYRKAKTDPDQRQKMNMEMMKLYGEEGISPVSGCLPIFLQLPILWAFYGLLSNAIELRGAPFVGWIHDLSAKDPYYITPLLMMITMFVQQQITPSTVDPVQKKVFMVMPLVFGFIFKEFPSGLVLYWLVQNILTIAQQLIMNRYWKDHPEALKKS